jgi:D-alanyl-D-alanine carboxypeptidase/D-alanyl-D-alanine-endopeptidase (penicillin-binding protein 4)
VAVLHHPNAHQARAALDQLLEWTVRDLDSTTASRRPRASPDHSAAPPGATH